MTSLRLLAVGDIHLGRHPSSVPQSVATWAGGLDALGPRAAWHGTVQAAIEKRVQAVLLLGDVVDDEERYVEGFSALESGLRKLIAADIQVIAVAGNHDVRVLPLLERTLSGFRLLGSSGRWEAAELAGGAARLLGWSYPEAHARTDPTQDPRLAELCATRFAGPSIGLLHGDLDATNSPYARFTSARLAAAGVDAWLLGHVHKPTFARAGVGGIPAGYLGSLTALDPTETGAHGPWLLAFEGRSLVESRQLALAPLRWERLELAVDAWSSVEDLGPGITGVLQAFEERERPNLGAARAVGLRIDLVGRTPFHRELRGAIETFDREALLPVLEERLFFVDEIRDGARPELDLQALARESDPPGLLAQRLLALDATATEAQSVAERARLLRAARLTIEALTSRNEFAALGRAQPADGELASELRAAGYAALEEILATRGDLEERA
jgi:DNA repair exonuclease SbcCD nuclease subunit